MRVILGGWTEGASIPYKHWADSIDMSGVVCTSANRAMVVFLTHLNFGYCVCNFKNLTAPKIWEILTSFGAYVFR